VKNLKCICVGALVAIAVSCATNGRASTLAYTVTGSIPPTLANWSSPLAIPQFQSNLGTLQSVTLTLAGSISTTLTAGNITNIIPPSQLSSGSAGTVGQFSLQDPSGLLSGTPQLSFMSPMEPYSFTAGGSQSWSLSSTGSGGETYTNSSILSEFTTSGTGTITLTASGSAFTDQINTGGASYSAQSTTSGALVDVTYTYSTAVPEPSTFALAGTAVATVVAFRRRRRRRVANRKKENLGKEDSKGQIK
jgi:hypothetical protein